jgi:hypothetical protein
LYQDVQLALLILSPCEMFIAIALSSCDRITACLLADLRLALNGFAFIFAPPTRDLYRGGPHHPQVHSDGRSADSAGRLHFSRRELFGGMGASHSTRNGFARSGFARSGFARSGFARSGFASDGFARNGFARNGFVSDRGNVTATKDHDGSVRGNVTATKDHGGSILNPRHTCRYREPSGGGGKIYGLAGGSDGNESGGSCGGSGVSGGSCGGSGVGSGGGSGGGGHSRLKSGSEL